jgi:cellulose synthase/poly-beta-1,6-N-acetylglucosamine synthase-like glycosyltransferase
MPGGRVPSFSVIIPSRLRHDRLAACLRSLIKSDYPRDRFDVIVVDQNSGMPPRAVLVPFAEQLNLAMIELSFDGAARALNAGCPSRARRLSRLHERGLCLHL